MTTQGEISLQQQPAVPTLMDSTVLQEKISTADLIVKTAHDVCDPYVDQLLHVEWKTVSEADMTLIDAELAKLEGRIAAGISKIDEQYKPLSRAWEAFRSKFTGAKDNMDLLRNKVKFPRIKMANEMEARIKKANEDKTKANDVAKEEVDIATAFNQHMMNCMFALVKNTTQKIYKAFLETPAASFQLFVDNLNNWQPSKVLHLDTVKFWAAEFKWNFQHMQPFEPLYNPKEWMAAVDNLLLPEKDKILKMVPLRLEQFGTGQVNDIPFAALARHAEIATNETQQQAVAQVQQVQAAATTNAAFEVASTVVVPEQNKGVKKNQVLAPASHEEWRAIVNFFMEKQFPHLNMTELNKKLGHMLTTANNIMKATGEMPKGHVTTVEAFSTRAAKRI